MENMINTINRAHYDGITKGMVLGVALGGILFGIVSYVDGKSEGRKEVTSAVSTQINENIVYLNSMNPDRHPNLSLPTTQPDRAYEAGLEEGVKSLVRIREQISGKYQDKN